MNLAQNRSYLPGDEVETRVVGVTFGNRQSVIAQLAAGEQLWLKREPENPYDHNAIIVERQNGQEIGHIKRELAAILAPHLDDFGKPLQATVTDILGGYYEDSALGVQIKFHVPVPFRIDETKSGYSRTGNLLETALSVLCEMFPDGSWQVTQNENAVVGSLTEADAKITIRFHQSMLKDRAPSLELTEQRAQLRTFFNGYFRQIQKHGTNEEIWASVRSRLLPVIKVRLADQVGTRSLVIMDWQPSLNLCIYLAIDDKDAMHLVRHEDLLRWGVTTEAAFQIAMSNLQNHANTIKPTPLTAPSGTVFACVYATRDGYDATRVLLPSVRRRLCQALGVSKCLVGIPNRDFLIAFLPDENIVIDFQPKIARDAMEDGHPLTDKIFMIDKEGDLDLITLLFLTDSAGAQHVRMISFESDPMSAEEHFERGKVYWQQGLLDEAVRRWEIAVRLNPNYCEAHQVLGQAYSDFGRLDEAVSEYQAALSLHPNSAKDHYRLGHVYRTQSKLEAAIKEWKAALQADANFVAAQNDVVAAFGELGRWDDAARESQVLARIAPDDPYTHTCLGTVCEREGRLDEAARECQVALRIDPNFAPAHFNLGNVYWGQDRLDEAIKSWQTVVRIDPNHVRAHSNLGAAYSRQGQLEKAVVEYQEALRLDPCDVYARAGLGYLHLQHEHLDEAIREFQEALHIRPEDDNLHIGLGIAYRQQKRLNDSLHEIQLALHLNPSNGEAHYELGVIRQLQGDVDGAISHARAALQLGYEPARELLTELQRYGPSKS